MSCLNTCPHVNTRMASTYTYPQTKQLIKTPLSHAVGDLLLPACARLRTVVRPPSGTSPTLSWRRGSVWYWRCGLAPLDPSLCGQGPSLDCDSPRWIWHRINAGPTRTDLGATLGQLRNATLTQRCAEVVFFRPGTRWQPTVVAQRSVFAFLDHSALLAPDKVCGKGWLVRRACKSTVKTTLRQLYKVKLRVWNRSSFRCYCLRKGVSWHLKERQNILLATALLQRKAELERRCESQGDRRLRPSLIQNTKGIIPYRDKYERSYTISRYRRDLKYRNNDSPDFIAQWMWLHHVWCDVIVSLLPTSNMTDQLIVPRSCWGYAGPRGSYDCTVQDQLW